MRSRRTITVLTIIASVLLAPLFTTNVHAYSPCQAGAPATCYLNAQTNIPSTEGYVWVRQDNNSAWEFKLPHLFAFTNQSIHTIEVLNLTLNGASGARYLWDSRAQWVLHGIQYTPTAMLRTPLMTVNYTGFDSFTAQFDKQFQYTLTFTDHNGAALSPSPTSITLSGPTGTVTTSAYSNQWLQAASWTIIDAKWEGIPGLVIGSQTIDLTNSPVTKSIQLAVYPATVKVIDLNNNPVSGANVTVTFAPPNSTSVSHLTGSQGVVSLGDIPLGPYTAHVTYQGQDVKWSEDASATPGGVSTITLNLSGTTSAPVVSAVVLLTIFGVAFFLILLAIKVRKPPPPPTI